MRAGWQAGPMPENGYHGKHEPTEPEAMLEGMRDGISDWEQASSISAETEAAERATGSAAALDYHMCHAGRLPAAWLEGRTGLIGQAIADLDRVLPRVENQVTLTPLEKAAVKRLREAVDNEKERT